MLVTHHCLAWQTAGCGQHCLFLGGIRPLRRVCQVWYHPGVSDLSAVFGVGASFQHSWSKPHCHVVKILRALTTDYRCQRNIWCGAAFLLPGATFCGGTAAELVTIQLNSKEQYFNKYCWIYLELTEAARCCKKMAFIFIAVIPSIHTPFSERFWDCCYLKKQNIHFKWFNQ